MTGEKIHGSCACGAVAYEIAPPFLFFQYCHCSRCRKTSGSPHAANILLDAEQFSWIRGEDKVRRWVHPEAERFCNGFCNECGSKLPWLTRSGDRVLVPTGTLDDDLPVRPERNIYWDSRQNWFVDTSTLPVFAESPVKAK